MESGARYEIEFEATELSLAPPGTTSHQRQSSKRPLTDEPKPRNYGRDEDAHEATPTAKAQVVGWPPVRSFRRNNFQQSKKVDPSTNDGLALFVKVSMDGAPYLRKIDLNMYKSYMELHRALDDMFKCFSAGSECAIAYEDKDGDWMLAGDVPWEMFVTSCKRLRIMKGNDAKGLGSSHP